jgi:hypothetical protein
MAHRRGYGYVLFVSLFELLKGFGGYFADFREIFVVILVALAAARPKLRPGTVVIGLLLCGFLLTLGSVWSAIKADYRAYLSQGPGLEARFAYLSDQISGLNEARILAGFDAMVKRHQYVDFLAATMRNVPAVVPFENGALIGSVVMHVLQPRLLFPDKAPLPDDTEITVRYSGVGVDLGGNAANTSISLGYVAELYVDLGVIGTLAAMLILGFIFGRSVRYLSRSAALPAILNSGLTLVLMMSVASFDESLAKMIGAFITSFAAILALRGLLPYFLNRFVPKAGILNKYGPRST